MLTLAFAQGTETQAVQAAPSALINLLPIAIIFIIFYFLLIRPQKKSQQEHVKMLAGLEKNDEVVTSGGIHGTIVNVMNDVVILRVDDNTRIKVQKSCVSRVKKNKEEAAK